MKIEAQARLPAPRQRGERPGAEPKERPTAEPKERPSVEPKGPPSEPQARPGEPSPGEQVRKGWLRRHPVAAAFGLILLLVAGAAGSLYWDYSTHFESTDDAFIAARQFAIAPKVAGYVTAVPVTDNQHVNQGDVIAEIDQRDYRNALAQAEGQVAGARSRHPKHRRADRHARRADRRQSGAGDAGAGEPGTDQGHLGARQAARQSGLGDGPAGHG